ncbi:MAG: Caspase domain-containing protein, partial [Microcystaceae cyanobacterium]
MQKLFKIVTIIAVALSIIPIKANRPDTGLVNKSEYKQKLLSVLTGKSDRDPIRHTFSFLPRFTRPEKTLVHDFIKNCQSTYTEPNFLAVGGGGAPSYNEIALEKNILYFQRTLKQMGYDPSSATIFFANGNDGQATVRYLDNQGQERFKSPKIPHLKAAATLKNFQRWIQQTANQTNQRPLFLYFTGHGSLNHQDSDNNALFLWHEDYLSVRQLANLFDRLPQNTQIVTMMAQCFAGSFANIIYQGGIPGTSVALQTRCGFFATVSTKPSVGCTPEVDEADYQDYSSSFFAGLSGVDRIGKPVASADYNRDGHIAYAEAHAFAKVDEQTTDLPISTSEVWLQRQVGEADLERILRQPIAEWRKIARPEQQYVID